MTMKFLSKAALALALPLAAIAPVHAADGTSVKVSVAGLDLSTAKGQRQLERRVQSAARRLCDTANERFSPDVRAAQRQCRDEAVASALAGIAPSRIAAR
jgi:UrcA family protein